MPKESTSIKFTSPAARIWNAIDPEDQHALVSKAWCNKCCAEVTVTDYSGSIKAGHVLLDGVCAQCNGVAYRFIEFERNKDKTFTITLGEPKLTTADAMIQAKLTKQSCMRI